MGDLMSHWCVYSWYLGDPGTIGLIIKDYGNGYELIYEDRQDPSFTDPWSWEKNAVTKFDSLSDLIEYWRLFGRDESDVLEECKKRFPNKMGKVEGLSLEEEFFSRVSSEAL